jgi:2-C-methyl-D-erythritol 4-phosphate cytidylyltransferase
MGAGVPKQYLHLSGKPVVQHTLEVLTGHAQIAGVVIVISAEDQLWPNLSNSIHGDLRVAIGGAERCHSVLAGLNELVEVADDNDWVMVHDAARPCLRASDIDKMISDLSVSQWGGILAVPVGDTLKRCNKANAIESTVDRTHLWRALTPQMFRIGTLRSAISAALANNIVVTDEAQAIEAVGGIPQVVQGHADNIKITHPDDLALAEIFLQAQGRV